MRSLNLDSKFLEYISAYQAKDLSAIQEMFSDDIELRDWNILAVGIERALEETKANFDAATSISIEVVRLFVSNHVVAGQLKITVNQDVELEVVDVVTFDDAGFIKQIRAYKG